MNRDGSGIDLPAPDPSIADALSAWAADPALSAVLRAGDAAFLVLSGDAGRVLHASEAGRALAPLFAGFASGLHDQVKRHAPASGRPALLRLQLDPRRLGSPVPCLLARRALPGGEPALLLVATALLPASLRRRIPSAAASAEPMARQPEAVPALPEPVPAPGARFVWRSDAEGRLGEVSGSPFPALRRALTGESWASLAGAGRLRNAEGVLAALAGRSTFRALPAELALEAGDVLGFDLFGTPVAQPGRPFEGFEGFARIRAATETATNAPSPDGPPSAAPFAPAARLGLAWRWQDAVRSTPASIAPEMEMPKPEAAAVSPSSPAGPAGPVPEAEGLPTPAAPSSIPEAGASVAADAPATSGAERPASTRATPGARSSSAGVESAPSASEDGPRTAMAALHAVGSSPADAATAPTPSGDGLRATLAALPGGGSSTSDAATATSAFEGGPRDARTALPPLGPSSSEPEPAPTPSEDGLLARMVAPPDAALSPSAAAPAASDAAQQDARAALPQTGSLFSDSEPAPTAFEGAPQAVTSAPPEGGSSPSGHESAPDAYEEGRRDVSDAAPSSAVAETLPDGSPAEGAAAPVTTAEPGKASSLSAAESSPLLSVNEHAAFREIAKALGARFAGDEEPDETADAQAESRVWGGSVTPFPARAVETVPAEATTLLEGVPAALMICRGEELLHANRAFLDLAGFPDLATLQAEGGLGRLFRGLAPHRHARDGAAVAMATRGGQSRGVAIDEARMIWTGAAAECLLVRPLAGSDPERETRLAAAEASGRGRLTEARAALDALEDGVVGLDREGRVLSVNRAAARLLGIDPRQAEGAFLADLFAVASAGPVRSALRLPEASACEVSIANGQGVPARLAVSLSATNREGGRVAVLREAARASAAAAERRARSGETADFAARLGREVREPMTSILGFADLMLAERYGPLGSPRYQEALQDIRGAGERLVALVDDLVELAGVEAGRRALSVAPLTLNDVVGACVAELQPEAALGRVVLRTSFAADLAPILADEASLRQAARAVIAAAIGDTAAGGQVIVSTTHGERGEAALRVRDTGIGLSPRELEGALRLPDPAEPLPRRRGGGPALGLILTRALVEANHGRLRVSSRKDEGTLVEMLFPVRDAALSA